MHFRYSYERSQKSQVATATVAAKELFTHSGAITRGAGLGTHLQSCTSQVATTAGAAKGLVMHYVAIISYRMTGYSPVITLEPGSYY